MAHRFNRESGDSGSIRARKKDGARTPRPEFREASYRIEGHDGAIMCENWLMNR